MSESRETIRVRLIGDSWATEYPDGTAVYFATPDEAVTAAHQASIEGGLAFVYEAESGTGFAEPAP